MVVPMKMGRAEGRGREGFERYFGNNLVRQCEDRLYLGISSDSFRKAHFMFTDFSFSILSK